MFKLRRRLFCKFCAVSLVFGLGLYLVLNSPEEIDQPTVIKLMERSIPTTNNKGECHLPNLPIDNPEIMKFYEKSEKLDCGYSLDDWVMCEKSICFVKPEITAEHGEVVCSYTDLIRKNDFKVKYGKTLKTNQPYILQESDFVKVVCKDADGKSWSGMAYGIRDTVTRPKVSNMPVLSAGPIYLEAPRYFNLLMLGFDSLSRNAFMRKLPQTYEYLTERLGAVVLKGYNIVGDGTPQALIPLLTGYTELELPDTRKRMYKSVSVDVYPMIWKKFARQGYVTSFNEDLPQSGTFTYRLKGFDSQPVDHYLRTFYVEVSNLWVHQSPYCIGNQPDHLVMLDYTKNFMSKYNDSPRFAFSFHGGLSHDSINLIGAADDDVVDWLNTLEEKQLLENTILIVMSDHGNRFASVRATQQGKLEERLPFFSVAFPMAFKKRFPQQYVNFVENAEKLTTPFDVHATLEHILKLQTEDLKTPKETEDSTTDHHVDEETSTEGIKKSALANKRAISLFERIPKNRSCADAYIEPHWCSCHNWKMLPLENTANLNTLNKMAASIVDTMNKATSEYNDLCEPLALYKINWGMRLLPNNQLIRFQGTSDKDGYVAALSDDIKVTEELYQLQIIVDPGESMFEATVTYNLRNFSTSTKLSDISRINVYGRQANCIYDLNPELRKFCYCRL